MGPFLSGYPENLFYKVNIYLLQIVTVFQTIYAHKISESIILHIDFQHFLWQDPATPFLTRQAKVLTT